MKLIAVVLALLVVPVLSACASAPVTVAVPQTAVVPATILAPQPVVVADTAVIPQTVAVPQPSFVPVTQVVRETVLVPQTAVVTPTPPSPKPSPPPTQVPTQSPAIAALTADKVVAAFKAAGLEAEGVRPLTKDDTYAPWVGKGLRFFIPSVCEDCGGRIFAIDNADDMEQLRTFYDELGKAGLLFAWVFVRDNILVSISDVVPEATARQYEAALQNATHVTEVTHVSEGAVAPTLSPQPPTQTLSAQKPIVVGEPTVIRSTGSEFLHLLVMFENPNTDWWMPYSHVTISVFDPAGKIIGTDSNVVTTGPGEKTPFIIAVDIDNGTYDHVQVELAQKELRPSTAWPDPEVELVQANLVGDKIVGQIKNTGKAKIGQTKVIVVVRDVNDKVIGIDSDYAADAYETIPGQTVPFQVNLTKIGPFEIFLVPEDVEGTY